MKWLPRLRSERVSLAVALTRFTVVETPSTVKVTVPVGRPTPERTGVTTAVKVTGWPMTAVILLLLRARDVAAAWTAWPNDEGFSAEPTVVEVSAAFTVCFSVAELLARKLLSPL